MKAGDVLEGSLTVCTNMGEKALPFSFAIMQKKVQLPEGEAFTLDSFAQLAKEHYEKAYAMFCSRSFTRTIEKQYPQFEALNRGLRSKTMSMELMDWGSPPPQGPGRRRSWPKPWCRGWSGFVS